MAKICEAKTIMKSGIVFIQRFCETSENTQKKKTGEKLGIFVAYKKDRSLKKV